MNKAVFLDRDGTINVERNYLYKTEDFEFIKDVPNTIKALNNKGYKVIVVTNQSGIGRGFYTENDVVVLHKFINNELKKIGAHIDDFYFCPHHPKTKCNCRKPKTELFIKAIKKWEIDCNMSYVVGDKTTDLIPGKALGLKTILVETGHGRIQKNYSQYCNYKIKDLSKIFECI